MVWFYCSAVLYVIVTHLDVSLIDSFLENQCFVNKHCFMPSWCVCNWYGISEKLAVIQRKKFLGFIVVLYFTLL